MTTELLLRDQRFAEGNPLMRHRAVRIATHAAYAGGMIYLHRRFRRAGEHGKARTVLVVTAAVWIAATLWNVKQLRRTNFGNERSHSEYVPPPPAASLSVTFSW